MRKLFDAFEKASRRTQCIVIYLFVLAALCATSGSRLRGPSSATHFSYQARMFLQGRLDLGASPPNMDDWAEVEYLKLKDGREVAGAFLKAQPSKFRTLGGKLENVEQADVESRTKKYYVSFPPFPAVIFMPFVAISDLAVNDVLLTILLAALVPMLLFLLLRRFADRGDSKRTVADDLWLVVMFTFGSVFYYSSILGQVWYTAHIVSNVLVGLLLIASLEGRHPFLAAIALGALTLTRPQMLFWGLFPLYELRRAGKLDVKHLAKMALPLTVFAVAGAGFNYLRFHSITEFGHSYLNVRWTDRIQRFGLFNYAFISRNLTVALTLMPKLTAKPPYVLISWHGMSLLLTTPALLYVLWPKVKGELHTLFWVLTTPIALLGLMYQNDGWVQFSYRFCLDFLLGWMVLLAVGDRPITRTWKVLILVGVVVNLYGAVTFNRYPSLYYEGFFALSPGEL